MTKADFICIGAVLTHFALVAIFYADLPDPVPSHWNAVGEVDGYTPKPWGAWLFPLITLGVFLLFKVIPWISPHGFRMETFMNVVDILKLTTVLFMLVVGVTTILAARGAQFDPGKIVVPGVGVLLLVIGNYMGKLRKNFFIGIRTPWTLASDEVWARTHRLGGWMFVLAGLFMVVSGLTGWSSRTGLILAVVLVAAFVPVVYSFIIYRRIEGFGADQKD